MDYKKLFSYFFIAILILSNANLAFSAATSGTSVTTFGQTIIKGIDSYASSNTAFSQSGQTSFSQGSTAISIDNSKDSILISFSAGLGGTALPANLSFLGNFNTGDKPGDVGSISVNKTLGEITKADVFVVNSAEYIFGNNDFYAPAGSEIVYSGGLVKILAPNNAVFKKMPSLLSPNALTGGVEIKGKGITLPDGVKIVNGQINYGINGELVQNGLIQYNDKLISVTKPSEQVLISNGISKNPSGNYIYDNNGHLEIQSAKGGAINMKFLPGEKNLHVGNNDNLLMQVKNGDGLDITQGKDGIPQILHQSSADGTSSIKDGKIGTLVYTKNDVQIQKGGLLPGIAENPITSMGSVPLSISSDSKSLPLKVGISSDNSLTMLSSNGQVATFNKNLAQNLAGFSYSDLKKEYGSNWANVLDYQIRPAMQTYDFTYPVANGLNAISLKRNIPISTLATFFPAMRDAGLSDKKSLQILQSAYDISSPSRVNSEYDLHQGISMIKIFNLTKSDGSMVQVPETDVKDGYMVTVQKQDKGGGNYQYSESVYKISNGNPVEGYIQKWENQYSQNKNGYSQNFYKEISKEKLTGPDLWKIYGEQIKKMAEVSQTSSSH